MQKDISQYPPEKKVEHYEWSFKAHLGTGSYGKVYLGKDIRDGQQVAIKIVATSTLNSNLLKYLRSEIDVMKQVKGDNVVNLLDVLWTYKNVYIITEYCEGGDLRQFMQNIGREMPEPKARLILKQIVQGFQVLVKSNLIHRDFKPENILLKGDSFKIADFGFARTVDSTADTLLNSVVGTPLYMSPQILKSESYTIKSDIWSIGLIYYEMLYAKLPYTAQSQYELIQKITNLPLKFPFSIQVSEESKAFIKECLKMEEKNRLDTTALFQHSLLSDSPVQPSPHSSFASSFDHKAKLLIQKIQMIIHKKKINIKKLFDLLDQQNRGQLGLQDFGRLIKNIDDTKKTSEQEIKYIFNKFDQNGEECISFPVFKYYMTEVDYSTYDLNSDPFLEEKANKILEVLQQKVREKGEELSALVARYDQENKGGLSREDFRGLVTSIDQDISEKEVDYMFLKLDIDNSQLLELQEIEEALQIRPQEQLSQERMHSIDQKTRELLDKLKHIIDSTGLKLKSIFRRFDVNKKRALDLSEFGRIMRIIDENIEDEEILHIFKKVDCNDDQLISYDEFQNFMK